VNAGDGIRTFNMRLILFYFYFAVAVAVLVSLFRFLKSRERFPMWPRGRKRVKRDGRETWVQVYDTDSLEEALLLQARLEEEELDCLVYEQGRKDVHGNQLKGFGVAVPRLSVPRAQKLISNMPA